MTDEPSTRTGRAKQYVSSRRIDELLYGAVVSGSILAVSSAHAENSDPVLLATALVSVTYWLAHVYVDAVGGRFHDTEHSTGSRLLYALRTNTAVLIGSIPPLLMFFVGKLLGMDVSDAAFLALWFTVALLGSVGAFAAYRAGARSWPPIGETAIAAGFGLIVIGLKIVLH